MIGIWEMIVLYIWAGENFLGLQNVNKHMCIIQIRMVADLVIPPTTTKTHLVHQESNL